MLLPRPWRHAGWGFSELTSGRRAWPRVKAGEQHGKNAGQKYAVKSASAADRSDRRAQARHLVEIGKISTDQRAEAASDIGGSLPLTSTPSLNFSCADVGVAFIEGCGQFGVSPPAAPSCRITSCCKITTTGDFTVPCAATLPSYWQARGIRASSRPTRPLP